MVGREEKTYFGLMYFNIQRLLPFNSVVTSVRLVCMVLQHQYSSLPFNCSEREKRAILQWNRIKAGRIFSFQSMNHSFSFGLIKIPVLFFRRLQQLPNTFGQLHFNGRRKIITIFVIIIITCVVSSSLSSSFFSTLVCVHHSQSSAL